MEVKAERFGTTLVLAPVGRNETIGADEFQRCIDDEIEAKDEKGRPRHGRREPLTVQPGPDAPLAGRGRYWRQQFLILACAVSGAVLRGEGGPALHRAARRARARKGRAGHIASGAGRTRLTARMEGGDALPPRPSPPRPSPRGPPPRGPPPEAPPPSHRERYTAGKSTQSPVANGHAPRQRHKNRCLFGNASCPSPSRPVTLSAFGQLAPSEVRLPAPQEPLPFSATLPAPAQAVLSPCRHSASLRRPKSAASATRTVAFSATLPAPAQAVLSPCRHSASLRRPKSAASATRTVAFSATLPAPAQAVLSPCRHSASLRRPKSAASATRTVAFSATLPAPAQAVLSPCRHSASLRRPKSDRLSGKFKVRHSPPRQQFSTEAAILILAFSPLNWTGLPVDLARIGFETRSAMRLTAKPDAKIRIAVLACHRLKISPWLAIVELRSHKPLTWGRAIRCRSVIPFRNLS